MNEGGFTHATFPEEDIGSSGFLQRASVQREAPLFLHHKETATVANRRSALLGFEHLIGWGESNNRLMRPK